MHPAIFTLLKAHAASRLRRIAKGFSSPRRIFLSMIVVALGVVWLGQTMASMLLREPWEPEVFRRWVSLPLMGYFLWHIVRVAWKRPDEAIEWLPEEAAFIVGGPFTPAQVLGYRVAVILTATLPKAILTTLVLWPDLSWSGPIGLLLALIFLELFRLIMDLSTSCLSLRPYQIFRGSVLLTAAIAMYAGHHHAQDLIATTHIGETVPVPLTQQAMAAVQSMRNGEIASTLETPFLFAADIVSGRDSTGVLFGKILVLLSTIAGMAIVILRLERAWRTRQIAAERSLWRAGVVQERADVLAKKRTPLPTIPFAGSVGPLVWRQCKRAWRYAGSLLVSMGIPALLSCLPLFSIENSMVAFIFVVCGVLFYTFVLLPEAIKFDFRLDSDHLVQLRMLPMSSGQVVVGQLITPVLLACLFQVTVICFAGCVRDVGMTAIVCASSITIPLTVIFVAIDNLVFLLYPHRPTQEGFEAFLRTILKFTGKSMLLTLAGGTLLIWAPVSAFLASHSQSLLTVPIVFYSGVCFGIAAIAWGLVKQVVRAYDQFDVSLDVA